MPFQKDPSEYVKNIRMFDFRKEGSLEKNMAGFFIGVAPTIQKDLHDGLMGKNVVNNSNHMKDSKFLSRKNIILTISALVFVFASLFSFIIINGNEKSPMKIINNLIFNPLLPSIAISFLCLYFCSGSVWTNIRGGPPISRGPDGQMQWIAAGNQNQFSQEPKAVLFLRICSFLSIFVISFVGPNIENNAIRRCILFFMVSLCTISISSEISMFRMKLPSYPFKILF